MRVPLLWHIAPSNAMDLLNVNIWDKIYDTNHWNGGSGPGSDPDNCRPYLDLVNGLIERRRPSFVLDIGCGDGRLANALKLPLSATYFGCDQSAIALSKAAELCGPGLYFSKWMHRASLILIKDVLQHLSEKSGRKLLMDARDALLPGGIMLITNDIGQWKPIQDGDYTPLDVTKAPYNLQATTLLEWPSAPFVKRTVMVEAA